MSIANKILVCLFCSEASCAFASCYGEWASTQACALGCPNCCGCGWTVCAPICHSFKIGDCGKGVDFLVKGGKMCLYGILVGVVSPIDGIINCVLYNKKNFTSGVLGISDITQNCKFLAKRIESALDAKGSNEPESTFKSFSP